MTPDGTPDIPDDLIDAAWALHRLPQEPRTEAARQFLLKYLKDRGYNPDLTTITTATT